VTAPDDPAIASPDAMLYPLPTAAEHSLDAAAMASSNSPSNTSIIGVLRRPVESALSLSIGLRIAVVSGDRLPMDVEAAMTTTELVPNYLDVTKLSITGFLARYREPTLTAYTLDLRTYLGWCRSVEVEPLRVTRAELEMYLRNLEQHGYAPATVARRFGTVATYLKFAVIDGLIPANPADAVTRPQVSWEGQRRTVLHPLEFAAILTAARTSSPTDHALVCLLGMIGLRISEACAANITSGTSPGTSCCT
jgi:hypothetical protein